MGPLHGVRIVEMAGPAPGPYAAMMLADMGADVLRVDRPEPLESNVGITANTLNRSRRSTVIDVKSDEGLDGEDLPRQHDRAGWPTLRQRLAEVFRTKTQAEWTSLLEGTDACFAPVLSIPEAFEHPHNQARGAFIDLDGVVQPAPAPRFSRTPAVATSGRSLANDPASVLEAWGGTR